MDPLTVAAGFTIAKQSIKVVNSALKTANDVKQIAHHIDTLFHTIENKDKIAEEKKKKKKGFSKMREAFAKQTGGDVADETSLGAVAADILEQKKLERQIYNLGVRIDNKFGEGTWKLILKEREQRIKDKAEKEKQRKEEEKLDNIYKESEISLAQKIMIESMKGLGIIAMIGGGIFIFVKYLK